RLRCRRRQPVTRTALALSSASQPLRRRLLWLGGLAGLAGLSVVLAVAAWGARSGALRSPIWVPAAWAVGLLGGGAVAFLVWRMARGFRGLPFAVRLEREAGWRSGALAGLLEQAASGTSDGLRDAADHHAAGEVTRRAPAALGPHASRLGRSLALTAAAFGGAVLLLGAAGVRHGPAALLWQPRHALEMLASPLRLSADSKLVSAGDS